MIGVSVPQVFNLAIANLITDFQCVEGCVMVMLGPFGVACVVVSECSEIRVPSVCELRRGYHCKMIPMWSTQPVRLFQGRRISLVSVLCSHCNHGESTSGA